MRIERNDLRAFLAIVDRLVWEEWDPIGVNDVEAARDEYEAYIGGIANVVNTATSSKDVFEHLWQLETEQFGLVGHRMQTEAFAERLFALREDAAE